MKVTLASTGRFYIYDLARQMERLGVLSRLYTAYPRWKLDRLPLDKVRTFPWLMIPYMAAIRLGWSGRVDRLNRSVISSFDHWLSVNLENCDIFHCLSSFGTDSRRIARERFGSKTICDRGSTHILHQKEVLEEEFALWNRKFSIDPWVVERELIDYQESDLIVVPSSFAARTFQSRGFTAEKVRAVPFGVDLVDFHPEQKMNSTFRVLFAGSLSLRKGIPYLLEALCNLNLPNFEICLVGGVNQDIEPVLRRYAGKYRFLGFKQRTELSRVYSQASVFVMPSIEEGLALVQAQAMACGIPLISTFASGAEDLFDDGVEGFIIPSRQPETIREKVVYLYEHPQEREKMAEAARKRVLDMGGWNRYGESMLGEYNSLLTGVPQAG